MSNLAHEFPIFDVAAYLKRKSNLGALDGLGAQIIPFAKLIERLDSKTRMHYEERAAIMECD